MRRRAPLVLVLLALAAAAAALAVVLTRSSSYVPPAAAASGEVTVQNATLRSGEIALAVRNGSGEPVRIVQVIVNDGFVDFRGGRIVAGAMGRVVVHYPWIEGESYEFELLTSDGNAVEYELGDAGAA